MVVAQRAGNRRAPGKVLADKGADHVLLEALLLVDDVIRNAQMLRHAAGIVHIIERTAAAGLGLVWDAMLAGQPRLVPKLKREANDGVA